MQSAREKKQTKKRSTHREVMDNNYLPLEVYEVTESFLFTKMVRKVLIQYFFKKVFQQITYFKFSY